MPNLRTSSSSCSSGKFSHKRWNNGTPLTPLGIDKSTFRRFFLIKLNKSIKPLYDFFLAKIWIGVCWYELYELRSYDACRPWVRSYLINISKMVLDLFRLQWNCFINKWKMLLLCSPSTVRSGYENSWPAMSFLFIFHFSMTWTIFYFRFATAQFKLDLHHPPPTYWFTPGYESRYLTTSSWLAVIARSSAE